MSLTMLKIEKSMSGHELSTIEMPYCGETVNHINDEREELKRIVAERDSHNVKDLKFVVKKNAQRVAVIVSKKSDRSYKLTLFSEPFARKGKTEKENPE